MVTDANGGRVPVNAALKEHLKEQATKPGGPAAVVKADEAKKEHPMMVLLTKYDNQIKMALPKTGLDLDRFKRIAVTTYNTNRDLQACEPVSFLAACMLAAQMGLEPGGPMGQAWLVPYKGKVSFQPGYKGYLTMMWRSKQYQHLIVNEVCERDEFSYEYGSGQHLKHIPANGNRGDVKGYYAYARYLNGGEFFKYFTLEDIEQYRKFSKMPNSPAWRDHYDAMARKTALIHAATWMPMSIEIERSFAQEGAIKSEIIADMTEAAGEFMDADFTDRDTDESAGAGETEGSQA